MDYEIEINYKYKVGDFVRCREVRGDNVEGLIKGGVYEVVGASMVDGNVIYSIKDNSGTVFHSMDVFEKVGHRVTEFEPEEGLYPADMVNHPTHYQYGGFEVIDIIDGVMDELGDGRDGYYIGNALKYLMRQHKKNGIEDVKKAIWYLTRLVDEK